MIIPANAGVGSAIGFLMAPVAYEVVRSRFTILDQFDADPINQFKLWFNDVVDKVIEPNAMVLGTYDKKNQVQNRVVLLKDVEIDGFVL